MTGFDQKDLEGNVGMVVLEKCVLLSLVCSSIGMTKTINSEFVEVSKDGISTKTDKKSLKAQKILLRSKRIAKINGIMHKTQGFLRALSIPFTKKITKNGTYVLPYDLVVQAVNSIEEAKLEVSQEVQCLIPEYPSLVADSKVSLGDLFNSDDYPPSDSLADVFTMEYAVTPLGPPQKLKDMDPDVYEKLKEQAAQRWSDEINDIQQALRVSFQKLISDVAEKLTSDENGNKKRLRDNMLDKVVYFLDTFNSRNVGNDSELSALVAQAREVLSGVDGQVVKSNSKIREEVATTFASITKTVNGMIKEDGKRKISFTDEEESE